MRLPDAIAEIIGDRRLVAIDDGQSGAAVYRASGAADDYFLKVGEGAAAGLVADEAARLAWLDGRFPVPRARAFVEGNGGAWLVTDALRGVSAGAYIKADRSRAVTVTRTIAECLVQLHAVPVTDCPFDSSVAAWVPVVRRLVADGQVDTGDFDDEHADWSAERVLAKVEELAGHARGAVVVHGDFSLGNIILDEDGAVVGCVDVGRAGVGDPYRDIFIGWRDLGGFGAEAQQAFLAALGMTAWDEPRRALHHAMDELF